MKRRNLIIVLLLLLLLLFIVSLVYPKEFSGVFQVVDANITKVVTFFGLSNIKLSPSGLFGFNTDNNQSKELTCKDYFKGDTFPGLDLSTLVDSKNYSIWDPSSEINNSSTVQEGTDENKNNGVGKTPSSGPQGNGKGGNKIFEGQICFTDDGAPVLYIDPSGKKIRISSTEGQQIIDMSQDSSDLNVSRITMTFLD